MNYHQALEFIHSRPKAASARTDLSRIKRLMSKLGNPQDHLRFVHIAGTNGKGSTATMCQSALKAAGYKTGLFVSPYVYDFRERMQVDGRLVPQELLASTLSSMLPALEEMERENDSCTEFETVTALALCLFFSQMCDVVVLEVGIGGRLDCTNIIAPPLCAAITSISLDHTEMLGNTTALIAAEKAGIIKRGGGAAIYCDLDAAAKAAVLERCRQQQVTPRIADIGSLSIERCSEHGSCFTYKNDCYELSLGGAHQIYNAMTVIEICAVLNDGGFTVPAAAVKLGLKSAFIPGRMEQVGKSIPCFVDGAHNPQKLTALARSLKEFFPDKKRILVVGMLEKKDHSSALPIIAQAADIFIAVTPNAPKPLNSMTAIAEAGQYCAEAYAYSTVAEGVAKALELADSSSIICACGSFYILDEAKQAFESLQVSP